MLGFSISPRADRDMEAASEWYARVSAALPVAFLEDVQRAIDAARTRPTSCPVVRRDIRSVLCRRFPYYVYFELFSNQIDVLAVYHAARDEAAWDDPDRE